MKKKKVWKSPLLEELARSDAESVRATLCDIAQKRHPACDDPEKMYDVLASQLEKLEKPGIAADTKEELELYARFLNTDAELSFVNDMESDADDLEKFQDDFLDLYAEACEKFIGLAKECGDKNFVIDVLHDLAVHHTGEEGRSGAFLSLSEFLGRDEARRLIDDVLQTLQTHDLDNEDYVFKALRDMADGLSDPEYFEKVCFLQDPDRTNATCIDVANAYFLTGDVADTERLLREVRDPNAKDEEEYLDLSIACLFKQNKKTEAIKLAETLYGKYPKEFHLARLCQFVSAGRRATLLTEHEKFRAGDFFNKDFADLLIAIEEFPRLKDYLGRHAKELAELPADARAHFEKRLADAKQPELAKQFA